MIAKPFLLWDTGSGKSTLINYLTGASLLIRKHKYVDEYFISNANEDSLPIGHDSKSATKIPALATDSKGNVFVDTPGFEDSEGFKANVVNGLILKKILNEAKRKKVILAIDEKNLFVNRGQALKVNLLRIKNMFGEESGKIMIVISKAKQNSNYRDFILSVLEDDSQNNQENK